MNKSKYDSSCPKISRNIGEHSNLGHHYKTSLNQSLTPSSRGSTQTCHLPSLLCPCDAICHIYYCLSLSCLPLHSFTPSIWNPCIRLTCDFNFNSTILLRCFSEYIILLFYQYAIILSKAVIGKHQWFFSTYLMTNHRFYFYIIIYLFSKILSHFS